MSIKVIGAGLGRTGTASTKKALEILGFTKCYHMFEMIANPEHVVHWDNAHKKQPIDWDAWMNGYQATVDFPVCMYYKEMMEHYPDAKVLLTIRDPEKWFESASSTIFGASPGFFKLTLMRLSTLFSRKMRRMMPVLRIAYESIEVDMFEGGAMDKETAIRIFNAHNEEVKRTVPADRLLVYSVKEGWEPLCKFLGVPVPDVPFPRVNQRGDFKKDVIDRVHRGDVGVVDDVVGK